MNTNLDAIENDIDQVATTCYMYIIIQV